MGQNKDEFVVKQMSMDEASEYFNSLTPEEENRKTIEEDLITTSEFPKHRALVSRAFKDAIKNIMDEFSPNNNIGVEYGCGSYAYLFTQLPDRFKETWRLFDINPKVIEHANKVLKDLGFNNQVEFGDIYNISKTHSNTPLIMGLSSWDSSFNLEDAMREVYNALSDDGIFIHVQDVFPAKDVPLGREWKRRKEHGVYDDSVNYKVYKDDQWCATEIESKALGWMSTIMHFILEMSDACKKIGFKEVNWGYKKGEFIGERQDDQEKYPKANVFHRKDIDYKFDFDKNLQKNFVHEKIELLTLTAKKS